MRLAMAQVSSPLKTRPFRKKDSHQFARDAVAPVGWSKADPWPRTYGLVLNRRMGRSDNAPTSAESRLYLSLLGPREKSRELAHGSSRGLINHPAAEQQRQGQFRGTSLRRLIVDEIKPALDGHELETATLVFGGEGRKISLPFIIQLTKRIFVIFGRKECRGLVHRNPTAFTVGECFDRGCQRRFGAALQSSG